MGITLDNYKAKEGEDSDPGHEGKSYRGDYNGVVVLKLKIENVQECLKSHVQVH